MASKRWMSVALALTLTANTTTPIHGQFVATSHRSPIPFAPSAGIADQAAISTTSRIRTRPTTRKLYHGTNRIAATRVYGQPDFSSRTPDDGGVSASSLGWPVGVAVDGAGGLYVADSMENRVLYYQPGSTRATRVYGQPDFSSIEGNNGGVSASSLDMPQGVAADGAGGLYVADTGNNRVLYYAPISSPSPGPIPPHAELSATWEAPYDGFTVVPGDRIPLSAAFANINGKGVFPATVEFGLHLPHGRWMTICTVDRNEAAIDGSEIAKRNGTHHTIEVATYTCAHDVSIPLHAQAEQVAVSFNAIISHSHQVNAPAGIRYGHILTPDLPARGPIQTYRCPATYLNACPGIPVRLTVKNKTATSATIAVATFCNLSVPSPSCQDDNPNDYSAAVMWDDATDIRPGGEAELKAELQNPQNHHIVPNAPIVRIEPAPKDGGRLAVVTTHLFQPMGHGAVNYFVVISNNRRGGRSVVVTGHVDVAMPYDPHQYADGTRFGDALGSDNSNGGADANLDPVLAHADDPWFTAGFFNAASHIPVSGFPFFDVFRWDHLDWTARQYTQLEQSMMTALTSGDQNTDFCDMLLSTIANTPGDAPSDFLNLYTDLANRIAANAIAANNLLSCADQSTLSDLVSRYQGVLGTGGWNGGEPKIFKIAVRYIVEHVDNYATYRGQLQLGPGQILILRLAAKSMQRDADAYYTGLGAIGAAIGLMSAVALPYPIDSKDVKQSKNPTGQVYIVREWGEMVGSMTGAIYKALVANAVDSATSKTIVNSIFAGAAVVGVSFGIAVAGPAISAGTVALFATTSAEAGADAGAAVAVEGAADGVEVDETAASSKELVKKVYETLSRAVDVGGIFTPLIPSLTDDPFRAMSHDENALTAEVLQILATELVANRVIVYQRKNGTWAFPSTQSSRVIMDVEHDLDPLYYGLSGPGGGEPPLKYYLSSREGRLAGQSHLNYDITMS